MKTLLIFTTALIISACSIFQPSESKEETTEEGKKVDEVYVFDEVSETEDQSEKIKELEKDINSTLKNEKKETVVEVDAFGEPIKATETLYNDSFGIKNGNAFFLQLGAFSSLKNAEEFVSKVDSQVPFVLSIIYNSQTSLYTVRSSKYPTKEEVEQIRDDFWSKNLFKDAFIVTE